MEGHTWIAKDEHGVHFVHGGSWERLRCGMHDLAALRITAHNHFRVGAFAVCLVDEIGPISYQHASSRLT